VRIERLGDLGSAPSVLRAIAFGAERQELPPPAALIGEWFGSAAVIAPSLKAVAVDDVFAVPTGVSGGAIGGGWFGYLSYPDAGVDGRGPRIPEAAGGWSDCVLRQDRDGQWWYESLSGAALPPSRGARPTALRTARACSSVWKRSRRVRSTRRACARSSGAGWTALPSTSSLTR
jgi:para-aminobenzoate synthetase component 1